MNVKYSAIGDAIYQWHVVTSHGTVVTGTVAKRIQRWERGWVAEVTYDDGERVVTPHGGRITGHADSRKAAVERAIHRHVIGEEGRWMEVMNT